MFYDTKKTLSENNHIINEQTTTQTTKSNKISKEKALDILNFAKTNEPTKKSDTKTKDNTVLKTVADKVTLDRLKSNSKSEDKPKKIKSNKTEKVYDPEKNQFIDIPIEYEEEMYQNNPYYVYDSSKKQWVPLTAETLHLRKIPRGWTKEGWDKYLEAADKLEKEEIQKNNIKLPNSEDIKKTWEKYQTNPDFSDPKERAKEINKFRREFGKNVKWSNSLEPDATYYYFTNPRLVSQLEEIEKKKNELRKKYELLYYNKNFIAGISPSNKKFFYEKINSLNLEQKNNLEKFKSDWRGTLSDKKFIEKYLDVDEQVTNEVFSDLVYFKRSGDTKYFLIKKQEWMDDPKYVNEGDIIPVDVIFPSVDVLTPTQSIESLPKSFVDLGPTKGLFFNNKNYDDPKTYFSDDGTAYSGHYNQRFLFYKYKIEPSYWKNKPNYSGHPWLSNYTNYTKDKYGFRTYFDDFRLDPEKSKERQTQLYQKELQKPEGAGITPMVFDNVTSRIDDYYTTKKNLLYLIFGYDPNLDEKLEYFNRNDFEIFWDEYGHWFELAAFVIVSILTEGMATAVLGLSEAGLGARLVTAAGYRFTTMSKAVRLAKIIRFAGHSGFPLGLGTYSYIKDGEINANNFMYFCFAILPYVNKIWGLPAKLARQTLCESVLSKIARIGSLSDPAKFKLLISILTEEEKQALAEVLLLRSEEIQAGIKHFGYDVGVKYGTKIEQVAFEMEVNLVTTGGLNKSMITWFKPQTITQLVDRIQRVPGLFFPVAITKIGFQMWRDMQLIDILMKLCDEIGITDIEKKEQIKMLYEDINKQRTKTNTTEILYLLLNHAKVLEDNPSMSVQESFDKAMSELNENINTGDGEQIGEGLASLIKKFPKSLTDIKIDYKKLRDEEKRQEQSNSTKIINNEKIEDEKINKMFDEAFGYSESITFPFKTVEEGNKFRQWVNDTYPDVAKELDLSPKGPLNSVLQNAWDVFHTEWEELNKTQTD